MRAALAAMLALAASSLVACDEPSGRPNTPDDGPGGVTIDAPPGVPVDAPAGIPPIDAPAGIPPIDAPAGIPPVDARIPPVDAPVGIPPVDARIPPIDAPAPPPIDAPPPEPDRLRFSLGDFKLMRRQRTRLRVQLVAPGGAVQDVTASAQLTVDAPQIVTHLGQGQLESGAQAGTATLTARLGSATPATVRITVTQVDCHPVINEVVTGASTAAEEFVEIFNPCTREFDVNGWAVVYRAANAVSGSERVMAPLDGPLTPGAFYLFAGRDHRGFADRIWPDAGGILDETSGAVGLRDGFQVTDPLIDAIAYGSVAAGHPFQERRAAPAIVHGRSASRLPFDGHDDDDGAADYQIVTARTPAGPNAP